MAVYRRTIERHDKLILASLVATCSDSYKYYHLVTVIVTSYSYIAIITCCPVFHVIPLMTLLFNCIINTANAHYSSYTYRIMQIVRGHLLE